MRALLECAAAVILIAATGAPALAQRSPELQEARRHMEIGQEYYLQERWEEAAAEFLAAQTIRPHPAFVHNAAMAFHRLGAASRAIELYEQYLEGSPAAADRADVEERVRLLRRSARTAAAAPPEGGPCEGEGCAAEECLEGVEDCAPARETEPRVRIERVELDPEAAAAGRSARLQSVLVVEAEPAEAEIVILDVAGTELARGHSPLEHTAEPGRLALVLDHPEYRQVRTPVQVMAGRFYVFHIEMSQPPAFLQVVANVPGATVYMDDRAAGPVGTTPWGDVVRTGAHRLWIERPGYETAEREVAIELGQEQRVEVELERLPFGMLRLLANVRGATVEVDGEAVGAAPIDGLRLEPGEHRLRVRSRGMKEFQTAFTVGRGQTTRVLVRMNPSPSRTSAWITLGFTAVTFAAAGVLGWYSTDVYRDLQEAAESGRLSTDDDRYLGGLAFAIAADVGFAIGTVMGALTLYYFLRDPLPPSEGRVEPPVDFTDNPEPERAPAGPADRRSSAFDGPRPRRARSLAPRVGLSPLGLRLQF